MPATGILLAGGRSRRMGQSKLDLVIGGETLLQRTAGVVARVSDEVLVTGLTTDHELPPHTIPVADAAHDAGPLGGLVAGLRAMHHDRAILVACDLPHLEPAVLRFLLDALGDSDAAVAIVNGRPQTTCAAYSRAALPMAERCLFSDRLSLRNLLDSLRVTWLTEDEIREVDPALASFANLNTPDDWERLTL